MAANGPGALAFKLPIGGISGPIDAGQAGIVLAVTDKQELHARRYGQELPTRPASSCCRRTATRWFNVFLGTLAQKYQQGGGIRLSKQAETPGSVPAR